MIENFLDLSQKKYQSLKFWLQSKIKSIYEIKFCHKINIKNKAILKNQSMELGLHDNLKLNIF